MTSIAERLLTADEFQALPDDPSGGKMELVYGRVEVMPPTGEQHGDLCFNLLRTLSPYVEENGLGKVRTETGFKLRGDPDLVRAPDVSFVAHDRLDPRRDRRKYPETAPNLAVEVLSPDDRDYRVAAKVQEYLAAGVDRVWVVRPELQTVTVHRPGGDAHTYSAADILTSDDAGFPVPGFELPVGAIFA